MGNVLMTPAYVCQKQYLSGEYRLLCSQAPVAFATLDTQALMSRF
jgi:hypothetical protein